MSPDVEAAFPGVDSGAAGRKS